MTVKKKILELFDNNKGEYISGQKIADKLSVSRNAVWKAVKALQNEGYDIIAVTNKGYYLSEKTDILSQVGISKFLRGKAKKFNIEVIKSISSTNSYLKDLASRGAEEGTVIVAEEQTEGRGRMGRSFFSPSNTGIYISVLLRPKMTASDALLITTAAAVSVAEAIEAVSDKKSEIKWVNDVYIQGKKVCGILTEASFSMENIGLEYVIVGIGVNVFHPVGDFPSEIKDIATPIFHSQQKDIRNNLTAEILNGLMNYYYDFHKKEFVEKYKLRSCVVGKNIMVMDGDTSYQALALDIDENCKLKVKTKEGMVKYLSHEEISVKV